MEHQSSFTLAGLKVIPKAWDKQGNFDKLEHFARRAAGEGAQVVVTPEGFLEGYVWHDDNPKDFSRAQYFDAGETIDGPLMGRVRALARELEIHLVVGFAELRDDSMYNSVLVLSPEGAVVTRYSKTHTAGNDEPFNTKGTEFPVVDTPLGRWGTLICMDRQLPETSRILAVKGAQLILVPAWGMYGEMNDAMMRTRACENSVHVAFVHPRRCLIIDPKGSIVAEDSGADDEIVSARITLQDSRANTSIQHRRPEIYGELLTPNPTSSTATS
ncbi:MAG: carbon-nitrogen hydrolase family protein [Acidimicrobiales bacterium]